MTFKVYSSNEFKNFRPHGTNLSSMPLVTCSTTLDGLITRRTRTSKIPNTAGRQQQGQFLFSKNFCFKIIWSGKKWMTCCCSCLLPSSCIFFHTRFFKLYIRGINLGVKSVAPGDMVRKSLSRFYKTRLRW